MLWRGGRVAQPGRGAAQQQPSARRGSHVPRQLTAVQGLLQVGSGPRELVPAQGEQCAFLQGIRLLGGLPGDPEEPLGLSELSIARLGPVEAEFQLGPRQCERGEIVLGYRASSVPFSFVEGKNPDGSPRAIGYAIDLCGEIADDIQAAIGRPVKIRYAPVTAETRIQAVADGRIDLECGSTTANAERRKQVAFSPVVSGKAAVAGKSPSMFTDPSIDFHWFPLDNPGLVTIPLSFLLAVVGTLTSREKADEVRWAEMEVRSLTGHGAEKAVGH